VRRVAELLSLVSCVLSMSSTRTFSERVAWTDDPRAIELLDWETKPEDFDRLYDYVVGLLLTGTHKTRERLLRLMSGEELRQRFAPQRRDLRSGL